MEVYYIREQRVTPNVKGSEKVVATKNNRRLEDTFPAGKVGKPASVFGDIAITISD